MAIPSWYCAACRKYLSEIFGKYNAAGVWFCDECIAAAVAKKENAVAE